MLRVIDTSWMSHLQDMDYLKTGIGLRAFGQRDPLTEYREEAHRAFSEMTASMYEKYLKTLLRLQIAVKPAEEQERAKPADDPLQRKMNYSSPEANLDNTGVGAGSAPRAAAPVAAAGKAPQPAPVAKPKTYEKDKDDPFANCGPNDPCPCGSGKKFKKCHRLLLQ